MTQKEILEGNKLIACFDGWVHSGKGGNLSNYYYKESQQIHLDDFEYHSSWNWLMPVCKFCNSNVNLGAKKLEYLNADIQSAILDYDIEKTFLAVVEYLKFRKVAVTGGGGYV